jgi:Ca-activated chloride channel family protein
MIAALLIVWNAAHLWRDTNSHAATARGVKAFAQKKYPEAVSSFGSANAIAPSPARAFNLGTAQIAAGNREQGSSTLAKAMPDPHLRADALFNRGNSALSSNAYDYAIRDYADALRLRPSDAAAKRNLEIALARKSMQQRRSGGSRQPQQGQSPQPQPQQPQSAPDDQQKKDANVEAILRSVQQQEKEELARLHRARGEKLHVGW